MVDATDINNEVNIMTFYRQISPNKATLTFATTRFSHANLLTFHIILSIYYHNHKMQSFFILKNKSGFYLDEEQSHKCL